MRLLPPVFAGLTLLCGAASAAEPNQPRTPIPGVKVQIPPVIDGTISPDEWPKQAHGTGFSDNQTASPAPRGGIFWISYDETNIYFAARLEGDPDDIVDEEYRENVSLSGNDNIKLEIDSLGSIIAFSRFAVSAGGAWSVDISGGRADKTEWNGVISAEARVTGTGWEAEMSIPWSILSLPSPGPRDLRFNVEWYERKSQRQYDWIYTNRNRSKSGVWQNVDIPKASTGRELNLLPYTYIGVDGDGDLIQNSGLDFKTNLTPTFTAVGTIMPDFRNIENQILSLDFSYFERLANESRPFFQEGADYRGGQRGDSIFASQRIDTFDTGVNLYGTLDEDTQFAFLSTVDFNDEVTAMTRVRRSLDDDTTLFAKFVGLDSDEADNSAGELSLWRRLGDWSVFAEGSFTNDDIEGTGDRKSASISHNADGGRSSFSYRDVSPDYFPRVGFAPQRGYRGWSASTQIERPQNHPKVMETEFSLRATSYEKYDGEPFNESIRGTGSVTFRSGLDIDVGYSTGGYFGADDELWSLSIEKPRGDQYRRWQLDYAEGNIAGEDYESVGASIRYRPIQDLQLALRSQWVSHFEDRRQIILGASWTKGLYESIGGRLVERDGKINWHVAWRRSGGKGAEYFLIVGDPNSDQFESSVILKATFPLAVKY
jgi:hypothetical protein